MSITHRGGGGGERTRRRGRGPVAARPGDEACVRDAAGRLTTAPPRGESEGVTCTRSGEVPPPSLQYRMDPIKDIEGHLRTSPPGSVRLWWPAREGPQLGRRGGLGGARRRPATLPHEGGSSPHLTKVQSSPARFLLSFSPPTTAKRPETCRRCHAFFAAAPQNEQRLQRPVFAPGPKTAV